MGNDKEFECALFKFSLISPLLHVEREEDRKRIIMSIAEREFDIPYSQKKRITARTINNYLNRYENEGFQGLMRQPRSDRKKLKSISNELLEKIIELKKEEPRRSARQIIRLIQSSGEDGKHLKERTVSRILKNRGLTRKDILPRKIYRSFEMENINDLWEVDISDGIFIKGSKKMTYLFAFIDDFSRIIPHAQFYYDEKLPRLEDCLKKAILKRGIPIKIYADNGKIFISNHLKRICAELGISLINHLPYSPQSKGKIERFFLRVKKEFLLEARGADIQSIEELNSFFMSWLEVEYHRTEHHAIGTTPFDRFAGNLIKTSIRKVESMEEITEIFLYRETRKVNRTTGVIKLNGNKYQVNDVSLIGKDVEVRFDPYDLGRIFVYNEDAFCETVYPVNLKNPFYNKISEENTRSEGDIRKSSIEFFTRLKQKEQELNKKESSPIDFTRLQKEE